MECAHDLGGRPGFGAVVVEPDEPVFHEPWERTARALVYVAATHSPNASTSKFRHSIERMTPEHYLGTAYYEHWLTSAATMAVEAGLVTPDELAERAAGPFPLSRPAADVKVHGTGSQRFDVGDEVRVKEWEPAGHTRCPGYVRGKLGTVVRVDGAFSLPDLEAHSTDRVHEATYSVRFPADELWPDSEPSTGVHVDLWDSYLERA